QESGKTWIVMTALRRTPQPTWLPRSPPGLFSFSKTASTTSTRTVLHDEQCYLARRLHITARALRQSLKENERVAAEKRGLTILRYQKWEKGQGGQQVYLYPPQEKASSQPKSGGGA
ncbi:hypothetical protein A0H81_14239, partial [Grifola frondosa]